MDDGLLGSGGRNRSGDDMELDITPMIDVTFLLLIFFMVTSTMKPEAAITLPPAKHGVGTDTAKTVVITIMMEGDQPKVVCADGEGPEASMEDVAAYVKDGLSAGKTSLLIKPDRNVPNGLIMEVARAAADENEGLKYFFAVREKKS